jgi:hypothetical protein
VIRRRQESERLGNDVMDLPSQSPNVFLARHRKASSKARVKPSSRDGSALHLIGSVGEDQKEPAQDGTDELGPDALDTGELPQPPRPPNIFSSLEFDNSLEANADLTTQWTTSRLQSIASPVRELNYALVLLNCKSKEIELLKVTLKSQQSHKAELDEELDRLKRNLELVNERYDEVNVALNTERTAKISQEPICIRKKGKYIIHYHT